VVALLAGLIAQASQALAAAACPPGDADYPPFYDSAELFDRAIEKVADYPRRPKAGQRQHLLRKTPPGQGK
jgi:hypothetical protein